MSPKKTNTSASSFNPDPKLFPEYSFELVEPEENPPVAIIKVVGIGGGGCNAAQYTAEQNLLGVEFIFINTDIQALSNCIGGRRVQIGERLTKGLGAGANPAIGRQAAEEDRDRLRELLVGTDMVFLTAGMGGGTGTGAVSIVAQVAKELGILTVAVVTRPFSFEGKKRSNAAEDGIRELKEHVDSLMIIPNNKLLYVIEKNRPLIDAFKAVNAVLFNAVSGITTLITRPGLINVDFADVRTVMSDMGIAMMGTGSASGENRSRIAAESAISSPLLEDIDLQDAKGVLVNITAGMNLSIGEFEEVGDVVKGFISDTATVVIGTVIDPTLQDEMHVTIVVTGLSDTVHSVHGHKFERTHSEHKGMAHKPLRFADKTQQKPLNLNKTALPSTPAVTPTGNNTLVTKPEQQLDYLDIPTFLRKREDDGSTDS